MHINFFDDPENQPRSREDVRIQRIGLFVHEDRRRVTFGVELTPFLERPCIEVKINNSVGQPAGTLTVIDTVERSFSLIMHLRDDGISDPYSLSTAIYYVTPETEREHIDRQEVTFNVNTPGEIIFRFTE